jgi:hypothetical protein
MGKIEGGESLVILLLPPPKPGDEPAEEDNRADEWNECANAAQKEIHRPLRTFEEIGDGGGVVHGDTHLLAPGRDWKQGLKVGAALGRRPPRRNLQLRPLLHTTGATHQDRSEKFSDII